MVGTHNASIKAKVFSDLSLIFTCTTSSSCTSLSLPCPNVLIITFCVRKVFNFKVFLAFADIYERWLPLSNNILVWCLTSVVSGAHMCANAVCNSMPLFSHPV